MPRSPRAWSQPHWTTLGRAGANRLRRGRAGCGPPWPVPRRPTILAPEENSSAAASPPITRTRTHPGDRGDGDTHARASETDTEARRGGRARHRPVRPREPPRSDQSAALFERRPIRRTPPAAPNFLVAGATNEAPYDEILDQVGDEDHFEPPSRVAPAAPQEDLHFWGIIVGLVGGPLLLLWLVLFRPTWPAGGCGWPSP